MVLGVGGPAPATLTCLGTVLVAAAVSSAVQSLLVRWKKAGVADAKASSGSQRPRLRWGRS
jgi:hypothetical protein